MRAPTLIVFGFITACGGPLEAPELDGSHQVGPPGTLRAVVLKQQVQPMFDRSCAQTACHGDPDRAFFIYSPFGTRLGSRFTAGLTQAEFAANLDAAKAFTEGILEVTDSLLLTRPLRSAQGGTAHGGGDQFYDRGDPGYVLLACWILGGSFDDLGCDRQ